MNKIELIVMHSGKIETTTFFKNGTSDYIFGALFIVLALAIFSFYSKTKKNAKEYKKKQMIEFKKQNPKSTNEYEKTGMFLPPWERTKLFAPIFFGLVFIIIGIAFLTGQPIKLWVD
ncbi:hypothetical protein MYMA111404_04160 [Mycoplasma marinum]|uniref:Uncharacterized protein n=1 Tax=Mycoplasma marinum TaxID=1937190 RepID=A0A4R0XJB0_9MOLU|nr:hypothetical protein [Mycoplasma marinum]TCG10703.1 hypothetical protein C4B24_04115 [Mycoplasma marinum]